MMSYIEKTKEWFEKNFSSVKAYDSVLWKNYLSVIGIISSIVTLISFFVTAEKININISCLAMIFIAIFVLIFLYMWWDANQRKCVRLKINGTKVQIQEGDIFNLLNKDPQERRDEISVIGVNDYFDTIVDNRVVAKATLHGKYILRIEHEGKLENLERILYSYGIYKKYSINGGWDHKI